MIAVRFEDVSKTFRVSQTKSFKDLLLGVAGHRGATQTVRAVRDLSFEIGEGESVALLGHNGSGKSTTLKMLAGIVSPSQGRIWARGRIAPLLELGAGFHPDLTGRENVFLNAAILGVSRREAMTRLDSIVAFAELEDSLDTPVRFYSSGMTVRLGFAIAANVDADVLLVDEVLAVGDVEFQRKCLEQMERFKLHGRTFILVTHSLTEAQAFCERAIVLDHGTCTFDGESGVAGPAFNRSSRTMSSPDSRGQRAL